MPGSGLPDYHKFKVLNCQLRKLMSVRLFCLRDIIDKEWNEAANFIPRIESPIDANKGYSLASILMSSPDQVKFAIDFYQEYLSEYNTESSLEKIIGSD